MYIMRCDPQFLLHVSPENENDSGEKSSLIQTPDQLSLRCVSQQLWCGVTSTKLPPRAHLFCGGQFSEKRMTGRVLKMILLHPHCFLSILG